MPLTDEALAEAGTQLADVLKQRELTIATAESCTGGWVAKVLTDRAGSSSYVLAGLVTYSNDAKRGLLGVTELSLGEHGAVSEPVVREMVAGALATTGADVAVAISGVAGPETEGLVLPPCCVLILFKYTGVRLSGFRSP